MGGVKSYSPRQFIRFTMIETGNVLNVDPLYNKIVIFDMQRIEICREKGKKWYIISIRKYAFKDIIHNVF